MIRFIRLAPLSSGEKVKAMFMPQCGNCGRRRALRQADGVMITNAGRRTQSTETGEAPSEPCDAAAFGQHTATGILLYSADCLSSASRDVGRMMKMLRLVDRRRDHSKILSEDTAEM